jgi:type VI secretion system protein ImpJ
MSWTSKIIWSEGMFLRPQHFQQNDRYFEALIEDRGGPLRPYPWGVVELTVNQEALSLGKVEIASCKAVLPDGATVNIPHADAPPLPIEPDLNLKNETIYLGLLERRPNAIESARQDHEDQETRYGIDIDDVRDTSLPEDSFAPLELGAKHLKLLGESNEREEFACIPICRIIEVRTDKQVILDPDFIATSMDCLGNKKLSGYIKEIQGMLKHRAEAISIRVDADGKGGTPQVADFMLLQLVNRYEPLFSHLADLPAFHPESLFGLCLQLAGELATFTTNDKRPADLPDYIHRDLAASFAPLMMEIRRSLGVVFEHSAEQVPLKEYKKWGIFLAVVNDKKLFTNADWVLAVKADIPAEKLRNEFPMQSHIGTKEAVTTLIKNQLPGVPLEPLPVAPREIPFHTGFNYFRLDRSSDYWKDLPKSGGLGLHPGSNYPGLELELWAIRG